VLAWAAGRRLPANRRRHGFACRWVDGLGSREGVTEQLNSVPRIEQALQSRAFSRARTRPASRDMTAHPREALHRNVIRGCRGPRRDRQCHAHSPCHGVGTEVPRSRGGGSARGESARTDVAGTVTTRDRPPRSIRAHVTGWFPGSGAIRFHRIGSAPSRLPRGTRWSVAELITPLPLRGQRRHQTGFPIIRSDSVGPAPATMPW